MIRSLSRGLDIIAIFNRRDSASASEISKELKMPRSTVYRILETLIEKKFMGASSFWQMVEADLYEDLLKPLKELFRENL